MIISWHVVLVEQIKCSLILLTCCLASGVTILFEFKIFAPGQTAYKNSYYENDEYWKSVAFNIIAVVIEVVYFCLAIIGHNYYESKEYALVNYCAFLQQYQRQSIVHGWQFAVRLVIVCSHS